MITTLAAGAIIFGVVSELTGGGIVRVGGQRRRPGAAAAIAGVPIEVLVFFALHRAGDLADVGHRASAARPCSSGANRATAEDQRHLVHPRDDRRVRDLFGRPGDRRHAERRRASARRRRVFFPDLTINVIAAVLVGGTAIQGGRGSPLRSAVGAVLIAVIANMMVLNDFSTGGRHGCPGRRRRGDRRAARFPAAGDRAARA